MLSLPDGHRSSQRCRPYPFSSEILSRSRKRIFRRLLAYSAVAHAGYALLGLVAGGGGFSATLFYTTIYAFTLRWRIRSRCPGPTGNRRRRLQHFAGLRALALARSLHGGLLVVPGRLAPLAGFFGKFYLFSAAMRAGGHTASLAGRPRALRQPHLALLLPDCAQGDLCGRTPRAQGRPRRKWGFLAANLAAFSRDRRGWLGNFAGHIARANSHCLSVEVCGFAGGVVHSGLARRNCGCRPQALRHERPAASALVLVKPAHYDDDGYVIQSLRFRDPFELARRALRPGARLRSSQDPWRGCRFGDARL